MLKEKLETQLIYEKIILPSTTLRLSHTPNSSVLPVLTLLNTRELKPSQYICYLFPVTFTAIEPNRIKQYLNVWTGVKLSPMKRNNEKKSIITLSCNRVMVLQ